MAARKSAPKKPAPRADYGRPIDEKIAKAAPPLREILVALRELIETTVPGVESSIKWGNPFFCLGGTMMAAMSSHKAHVNLILVGPPKGFDDPKGLLTGAGKGGRHLKLTSIDDLPRADVKRWLETAAEYARSKR